MAYNDIINENHISNKWKPLGHPQQNYRIVGFHGTEASWLMIIPNILRDIKGRRVPEKFTSCGFWQCSTSHTFSRSIWVMMWFMAISISSLGLDVHPTREWQNEEWITPFTWKYIYIHGIDMELSYNVGISQNGWFTMQHPFKIVDLGGTVPPF